MLSGEGLAALRGDRLIFAGLDFEVPAGGLLTLTGRNGAGKSTLIRIIAGLVRPFAGRVSWQGRDVARDRDAFAAEFLYSGHLDGLKLVLTAAENLSQFAALRGFDKPDVDAALTRFGIAELADLPVGYMSAGQRRRVALSRLVLAKLPLWLLDEPLTALDRTAVEQLGAVADEHRDGGGLIVAATHADLPGRPGERLEITAPEHEDDDLWEAVS